jgi:RNA polymerase sigma-70 factor (ECF subfamily)
MTDAQLVTLAQGGDREAFSLLARRWSRRLHRFLGRVLGNDEEARDTCQEALLRAWINLHRLREPDRFSPWIHRIAVNLCRDRGRSARSRRLREVALAEVADVEHAAPEATPHEAAERQDLALVLRTLLARLPLEQRTAILLRELEGLTSTEIAEVSGVPAATIRSRIFYGLKSLRAMLPEYGMASQRSDTGGPAP